MLTKLWRRYVQYRRKQYREKFIKAYFYGEPLPPKPWWYK